MVQVAQEPRVAPDNSAALDKEQAASQGISQQDAIKASQELFDAMKGGAWGIGCEDQKVMAVMKRLNEQDFEKVAQVYNDHHGRNLDNDLKSELNKKEYQEAKSHLKFRDASLAKAVDADKQLQEQLSSLNAEQAAKVIVKAVEGYNGDFKVVDAILATRSKKEIEQISKHIESATGDTLQETIEGNYSGREEFELGLKARGKPATLEEHISRINERHRFEREGMSGGVMDLVSKKGGKYDKQVNRLNNELAKAKKDGVLSAKEKQRLAELASYAKHDRETYTEAKNTVAEVGGTVAGAVGATVATVATAGAGALVMAGTAAAVGAGGYVAGKGTVQGSAYDKYDLPKDIIVGSVEGAATVASAGAAKAVTTGARTLGAQVLKKSAAASAEKIATSTAGKIATKGASMAVESGVDGAVGGFAGGTVRTASSKETWENGIAAGVKKTLKGGAIDAVGGMAGGAIGGTGFQAAGAGLGKAVAKGQQIAGDAAEIVKEALANGTPQPAMATAMGPNMQMPSPGRMLDATPQQNVAYLRDANVSKSTSAQQIQTTRLTEEFVQAIKDKQVGFTTSHVDDILSNYNKKASVKARVASVGTNPKNAVNLSEQELANSVLYRSTRYANLGSKQPKPHIQKLMDTEGYIPNPKSPEDFTYTGIASLIKEVQKLEGARSFSGRLFCPGTATLADSVRYLNKLDVAGGKLKNKMLESLDDLQPGDKPIVIVDELMANKLVKNPDLVKKLEAAEAQYIIPTGYNSQNGFVMGSHAPSPDVLQQRVETAVDNVMGELKNKLSGGKKAKLISQSDLNHLIDREINKPILDLLDKAGVKTTWSQKGPGNLDRLKSRIEMVSPPPNGNSPERIVEQITGNQSISDRAITEMLERNLAMVPKKQRGVVLDFFKKDADVWSMGRMSDAFQNLRNDVAHIAANKNVIKDFVGEYYDESNIFYVIPEEGKSYDLMAQHYCEANRMPTGEEFVGPVDSTQVVTMAEFKELVQQSGDKGKELMAVVVDDLSASGNSMITRGEQLTEAFDGHVVLAQLTVTKKGVLGDSMSLADGRRTDVPGLITLVADNPQIDVIAGNGLRIRHTESGVKVSNADFGPTVSTSKYLENATDANKAILESLIAHGYGGIRGITIMPHGMPNTTVDIVRYGPGSMLTHFEPSRARKVRQASQPGTAYNDARKAALKNKGL